jgi:hypothetical protein
VKWKPHPDDVYRERLVHPRRVPTVYYLPHPTLLPSRKGFGALIYSALPRHHSFFGPSTQRREPSRAIHAGAHVESSIRRAVSHSFPHSA